MGNPSKRLSFKEFVRPMPRDFLRGLWSIPKALSAEITWPWQKNSLITTPTIRVRDEHNRWEIRITVRSLNES